MKKYVQPQSSAFNFQLEGVIAASQSLPIDSGHSGPVQYAHRKSIWETDETTGSNSPF